MSKIYVASSWRNELQPPVVGMAESMGHEVYDFRNPPHGKGGFSWSEIDPNWRDWSTNQFAMALNHTLAVNAFLTDKKGMEWADFGILVLPAGRSAHVEAGWMQGVGMPVYVFSPGTHEPELMYKIFPAVISTWGELRMCLKSWKVTDR